ncbi:Outer capsid protein VP4 [Bienertia sinuspersici]
MSNSIQTTPFAKTGYGSSSSSKRASTNYFCTHCQIPGHSYERCFKVHGFPPNF